MGALQRIVYRGTVAVYCIPPPRFDPATKRTQQSEAKSIKAVWIPVILEYSRLPESTNVSPGSTKTTPDVQKWSAPRCWKRVLLRDARPAHGHALLQRNTGTIFYIASVSSKSLNACWFWFNCIWKTMPRSFGFHQRTDNREDESAFLFVLKGEKN